MFILLFILTVLFCIFLYLDYKIKTPMLRAGNFGAFLLVILLLVVFFQAHPLSFLGLPFAYLIYLCFRSLLKPTTTKVGPYIIFGIILFFLLLLSPIIILVFAFTFNLVFPYLTVSTLFAIVWIILVFFKKIIEPYRKKRVFFALLGLSLLLVFAYQKNPTVYFRLVTLPQPVRGQRFFWSQDILTLLKIHEERMVLELQKEYPDIHSITFQDIWEIDHMYNHNGKSTHVALALVNGQDPVQFTFQWDDNISKEQESDYGNDDGLEIEYQKDGESYAVGDINSIYLNQIDSKFYQDKLRKIKIDYYLKPDVFKD